MQTTVVAKVFIANEKHQVLLLQRSDSDPRRPLQWDIPGGHTDNDEYTEEAAMRETIEETGIILEDRSLKLVATRSSVVAPDVSIHWLFYYVSVIEPVVTVGHEHVAFQWVSVDRALELLTYDVQHEALQYAVSAGFFA